MTLNRRILALALPSIAANITTPLLGLVDTAVTGHMGSARYLAAISVGGVMFNMLYWLFGFLRSGTSGLTAQALGADDRRGCSLALARSLTVAVSTGLLMILLRVPIAELLTSFLDPDSDTAPLARRYFSILIWGAPAMLASYAFTGWYLGMQNSKVNLVVSLVVNIVNIAASITLVYGFGMKIEGVAYGTLTAQWCSMIPCMIFLRKYRLGMFSPRDIVNLAELKRFFGVNTYIMLRTVFMILVTLWFTREGARQGAVILAVNTMLMQFFMLFSYFMDGFAFAGEALVGLYAGARDLSSERRCVSALFRWGMAMSGVFTVAYFVGGDSFLRLLSSEVSVIMASGEYWWWALTVPFAGFAAFIWDGVYVGATMTRQLAVATLSGAAIFFAADFALVPEFGNHGLWGAFILYLLARGITQWVIYRKRVRQTNIV